MNILVLSLSLIFGLIPLNRLKTSSNLLFDYVLMLVVPAFYLVCYYLVNFDRFGVYQLPDCGSICHLGNTLFMHLGCFLYLTVQFLAVLRRKRFFAQFEENLHEIDELIAKCSALAIDKKPAAPNRRLEYFTWLLVVVVFVFDLGYDIREMFKIYMEYSFVAIMVTTFPYFVGSIVQGQFIHHVAMISKRFSQINTLFEKINQECDRKNAPVAVFDIESDGKKIIPAKGTTNVSNVKNDAKTKKRPELESESSDDDAKDDGDSPIATRSTDGKTSETNLPDLFKLHDKILALSVLTNGEFGPQCVPYMAACFAISIFGIFLETKVIFVVGGKNHLLDYVVYIYVIWSVTTMLVAYLVLRFCCNTNAYSKQSAMTVHEIMQKKPAFMLDNDFYYNKMKSFTLQFLHWEGYFQFNGIGLFALDYTFIFSTVSAATSYLIVLLQFDMGAILKAEGLT